MAKNFTLSAFLTVVVALALMAFSPNKTFQTRTFSPPSGGIVNLDTVSIHIQDCTAKGKLCLPIPLATMLKMDITDNGEHGQISLAGCDFDSVMAYTVSNLFGQGSLGPYLLNSWSVDGVIHSDTFQTIPDLVTLMNGWDTLGHWVWDPNALLISGGHPGSGYSSMDVTVLLFNTPSSIGFNLGFDPKGTELSFVRGFHEVILNDTINNQIDTFYVHVSCSDYVEYSIQKGDTVTYCLMQNDIQTNPVGASNVCDDTSHVADFALMPNGICLQIVGNEYGIEHACWILCDATGFCDTTFLTIRTLFPSTSSLTVGDVAVTQTKTFCFDTLRLNSSVEIFNFCQPGNETHVDFTLDPTNFCVHYTGVKIGGPDTACVVICDDLGTCDTMTFIITSRASQKLVYDTLFVGSQSSFCIDSTVFFGDNLTVTNFCQNSQNQSVLFDFNPVSLCYQISAIEIGTNTACLSICDEFGACDTVRLIITAVEEIIPLPPLANPDHVSTLLATPAVISVLNNDLLPDSTAAVTISVLPNVGGSGPIHGTATVDLQTNTIVYTPDSSFCDGADAFFYTVCQNGLCDTALVSVTVSCFADTSTTLIFYTGFSPNGDQVNDFFTIKNSEKYPNNDLTVFTRWGNRVFFQKDYRGTWNGTWNGEVLPDGIYFYVFNDGQGGSHKSYVAIRH